MNTSKKVIAVKDGECRVFNSMNEAARELRASYQNLQIAILRAGKCNGWDVYDSPENIRERIVLLQEQLKMLKNMGITE